MNNLVDGLRVLLASTFVLYLKTHAAHWNIRGMFFLELHELFDDQYNELWKNIDLIAEKVRELDCDVCLTPHDQLNLSVIESDQSIKPATGYVQTFLNDHELMIMLLNHVFKLAENENNQAVMNYLAERLDDHAKQRWFLKSLLDRIH